MDISAPLIISSLKLYNNVKIKAMNVNKFTLTERPSSIFCPCLRRTQLICYHVYHMEILFSTTSWSTNCGRYNVVTGAVVMMSGRKLYQPWLSCFSPDFNQSKSGRDTENQG